MTEPIGPLARLVPLPAGYQGGNYDPIAKDVAMTETNPDNPWSNVTDEQLADHINYLRKSAADLAAAAGRMEMELTQRLEGRRARELQHPTLQVFLDYGTAQYDIGKLMPLAELVPPEDWGKAWHPETTKEVPVPAGLDMRVAGGWGKRFGVDVAAVLAEAKLPSAPRLVSKDKQVSHDSANIG